MTRRTSSWSALKEGGYISGRRSTEELKSKGKGLLETAEEKAMKLTPRRKRR